MNLLYNVYAVVLNLAFEVDVAVEILYKADTKSI